MRDCGQDSIQLMAYADGQLNGEEKRQVERHLELCADCRGEVAAVRALSNRVAAARGLPDGSQADIASAVMRRVREERPRGWGFWQTLGFTWGFRMPALARLGTVALTVLLVIAGTFFFQSSPTGDQTETPLVLRPVDIQVDTDLDADFSVFTTEQATIIWFEEEEEKDPSMI